MKVVVTIDTATREGQEAFDYIKRLRAPEKSIAIQKGRKKNRKLTDEEMGLPGAPPSRGELDAWLAEPDGESFTLERAREETLKYLRRASKRKNK